MAYLTPRYDPSVVIASVLIASFASYVALDLAKRVRPSNRKIALTWWVGGSTAMGTGIWAMHFVGMLAFSLPIALGYTGLLTFISWAAAVAVSIVALGLASRGSLTLVRLAGGSVAMGAGICAMHYIGMAALDMSPPIVWNVALVAASAAVAVVASAVALLIFFWLRRVSKHRELPYQAAAAAVMGLAISGMHYTGMAAAGFPEGSVCLSAGALSGGSLSTLVGLASMAVLGLTLYASIVDGRMQEARLASSLQIANAELQRTTESLKAQIVEREHTEIKLQAQLERLRLLDQITCAIGERQDLKSINQVVIHSLEDQLPLDFSCVCRRDPATNSLIITSIGAGSRALAAQLGLAEQSAVDALDDVLAHSLAGGLVYESELAEVMHPLPQRLAQAGLHSLVAAPLSAEGRVFGVLLAARRQAHGFSSGECEFLRQLSGHVALAAQQAQLYGALQQAYDELRQTQQAVLQQERLRALGQMASGIAHDINNAISPVALYTQSLLEREPDLSPRTRDYLENIDRAIADVASTVSRMREFYRQRMPQADLAPVQLNELIRQVLDLTRVRWSDMPQQRGLVIDLRCDLAPELPLLMGVESELREALINLIFNAVDAMPEGGTLTLHSRATPTGGASVQVIDSGVGMDEETRRRCLEPFFTTKGERGTGLGLGLVYGVVQRHGADLQIDSALGEGTCVTLRFPLTDRKNVEAAPEPRPAAAPQRQRLLLVDDDPVVLKSLQAALEAEGHSVHACAGGQAGIDAFRAAQSNSTAFNLVITDLGMPYIDGRKVAAAIKQASPSTPVVLLTGWGQRMVAEGEVPEHVDQVLSKPPKLRELRETLSRLWQAAPT